MFQDLPPVKWEHPAEPAPRLDVIPLRRVDL
jgi:hypothetical protein